MIKGSSDTLREDIEVSVLFSDICGWSTLTENLEAIEVASLLGEYFESMIDAVFRYKESLDKQIELACIGNSLTAMFGSPQPLENHAWMAVQTAMAMSQQLAEFNARRTAAKLKEIRIGIGINSDKVSRHMGRNRRLEFNAIGDGINLGYLLEGVSKQYACEIVMGENTYRVCEDRIWARELDSIRLRAGDSPVRIYQLMGVRSESISAEKQELIDRYYKGRKYYLNRQFAIAMGEFATVLEIDGNDKAANIHLKRCQRLLKEPPPADWDGAWILTE